MRCRMLSQYGTLRGNFLDKISDSSALRPRGGSDQQLLSPVLPRNGEDCREKNRRSVRCA